MLGIEHLTKTYGTSENPVVNGLNLTINSGEFCIILGANGSGKSTLLKLIAGEIAPECGRILLKGRDITSLPLESRAPFISFITQDSAMGTIDAMSILENLSLGYMRNHGTSLKPHQGRHELFKERLMRANLGLENHLKTPLSQLSGGQRQAVALMMGTLTPPDLLLLDEHTSALDPQSEKALMQYTLGEIDAHQITTLMITHNLDQALRYGNRLLMFSKGKIILDAKNAEKEALTKELLLNIYISQGELS